MSEMDAFETRFQAAYRRYLDEIPTEVDAAAVARAVAAARPRARTRFPVRLAWIMALVGLLLAATVAAVFVGSELLRRSNVVTVVEPWDPILSETRAGSPPPAATCPPDTDPDRPGPADQERPWARWTSSLAVAFDRHTGRIVYPDTLGETWTFDVCSNTWHRMDPTGAIIVEFVTGLVYDVDSDVTVALGQRVSVYDANTNTWTQASTGTVGIGEGLFLPIGAVYDPISGLILTMRQVDDGEQVENDGRQELWAYDVDTNDWTLVGTLTWEPTQAQGWNTPGLELLGYSQMIDRLIFGAGSAMTVLVDPRTGEATTVSTDTPAPVGILGLWTFGVYGPAADSVYVKSGRDDVCGFDAGTRTWSLCLDTPDALQDSVALFNALVGDPINQRLILINDSGDWGSDATDDVWAIDLDSGKWTQILEPSNQ